MFFFYVFLGRSFEIIDGVEESFVEKGHEFFVVVVGRIGSSDIDKSVMFVVGRSLSFLCRFFLWFMFDGFESGFAERFAVE